MKHLIIWQDIKIMDCLSSELIILFHEQYFGQFLNFSIDRSFCYERKGDIGRKPNSFIREKRHGNNRHDFGKNVKRF